MKPKSMKEFLRGVELPYELWTEDGRYLTTLCSERDRREAMRMFRRTPPPRATWDANLVPPEYESEGNRRFIARSRARLDGE